jgi:hypothetical protein
LPAQADSQNERAKWKKVCEPEDVMFRLPHALDTLCSRWWSDLSR